MSFPLELRLSQPEQDTFFRPVPPGTSPPADQTIVVSDWRSASLAYLRFRHEHFLKDCMGEIFEQGRRVAVIASNGRVWPPEKWTPDLASLFDPSIEDIFEAQGRTPPTQDELAALKERADRIREENSWPKPERLKHGQDVLLFATPSPIYACRGVVTEILEDSSERKSFQYQTKSDHGLRWDNEEGVHARLPNVGGGDKLDPQTAATLRAEFAAIPLERIGKTLGEIVVDAMMKDAHTFKFEDYGEVDLAVRQLLQEMVQLAGSAFSRPRT